MLTFLESEYVLFWRFPTEIVDNARICIKGINHNYPSDVTGIAIL